MRRRGSLGTLLAALALVLAACSGDDETAATTSPAPTATEAPPATSTGATEQPPATTTEPSSVVGADPALIADAAGKTAAAGSARMATEVRVADPGRGQTRFAGEGAAPPPGQVAALSDLIRP